MSKPVILLTDPVSPQVRSALDAFAEVRLAAPSAGNPFLSAVRDANAMIVRSQLPGNVFDDAPRMLVVVRHGAGVDMVPIDNATANGVAVAAVPGANRSAVAEYAVGQMIQFNRRLGQLESVLRKEGWTAARALAGDAMEIGDKSVGIIGLGAVGTRLAEICHFGFGMRVLGNRRNISAVPDFVTPTSVQEIFARADFVVLACPLTEQTRGMADRVLLGSMKPDAVLVNLARGPVVDNSALLDVLTSGAIAGAILDVFDPEPLPQDSPFLRLENVAITPHCSGISKESAVRLGFGAVEEIKRVLAGTHPQIFYNPTCWDVTLGRLAALQGEQV